jgi:hypothetical protein
MAASGCIWVTAITAATTIVIVTITIAIMIVRDAAITSTGHTGISTGVAITAATTVVLVADCISTCIDPSKGAPSSFLLRAFLFEIGADVRAIRRAGVRKLKGALTLS